MSYKMLIPLIVLICASGCAPKDADQSVYVDLGNVTIKEASVEEFERAGISFSVDDLGRVYVQKKDIDEAVKIVRKISDKNIPRHLSISVDPSRHESVIVYLSERGVRYREITMEPEMKFIVFESEKDLIEFRTYFEELLKNELLKSLDREGEKQNGKVQ